MIRSDFKQKKYVLKWGWDVVDKNEKYLSIQGQKISKRKGSNV